MENYKAKIREYITAHTDELIEFLTRLISYKSTEGEAAEGMPFGKACAEVLAEYLNECEKNGLSVKNFDNYAAHADLGSEPDLGILCHLDVVPEGEGWSSDPYSAYVRDGRIYGRGAIDDKGPAAAVLLAVRCIRELGIPLKKGVRIIVGCNEENGSADIDHYLKYEKFPSKLVTPDGDYPVINIEKGMLRCRITGTLPEGVTAINGGGAVNAVPAKCQAAANGELPPAEDIEVIKNSGISELTAVGICAHASSPEKGDNAVTKLLAYLANKFGGDIKALSELFPRGETDGRSAGVNCSDGESGALTLVLSTIESENGKFTAYCDCRYPVSLALAEISKKLTDNIKAKALTAEMTMGSEPHFVDPDSGFIKTLLSVYEDITGNKGECIAIGGGTYVHDTDNGVAFGAEFPGENNNMHGADESAKISSLLLTAEIYANMICRLEGN